MIDVKNVTKKYGNSIANSKLNFSIKKGELVGLLGENGSGKTTLISLLSKELKADEGAILLNNGEIDRYLEYIGICHQEFGLFDFLTVEEHLRFFNILRSKGKTQIFRYDKVVEELGLSNIFNKKVIHLSGGERRRVAIALTLISDPEILLLDEPTANLDVNWRDSILNFIIYLNKEFGKTIIFSSHYLDEVQEVVDRVLILKKGKLVMDTTLENFNKDFEYKKYLINNSKLPESVFEFLRDFKVNYYSSQKDTTIYLPVDRAIPFENYLRDVKVDFNKEKIEIISERKNIF